MSGVAPLVKGLYGRFRRYLSNTSWILGGKVARLAVGLLVSVAVARHLGPDRFGTLSYAFSVAALFGAAGHLGLMGLVIRELVREPERREEILGTTFVLKAGGVALGVLLLVIFALATEEYGSEVFWVVLIAAASLFPMPGEVFDFWFQAQVRAKYTILARTTALLVAAVVKLALVMAAAGVVLFAVANLFQAVLAAVLLLLAYQATAAVSVRLWTFSLARARSLVRQGWVIFLGTLFAFVYLKIDQVMLRWLVGAEEVGIYAVAATLSELWYFVPAAIVASVFPPLIALHRKDEPRFQRRFQQLCDMLLVVAAAVAIVVTFAAGPVISLLYGPEYSPSAAILAIHIWAGLFIFLREAFSKWILIEDALVFSLITQGLGAMSNVILNLLLIPEFAAKGAAYATIISYAMASYLSLLFYGRTRPVFWVMTRAFAAPVRWPLHLIRQSLR